MGNAIGVEIELRKHNEDALSAHPMHERIRVLKGSSTDPAIIDELNARVPLGRIPSDQEVAGSIVYLASDLSSAMTGQAIDTNGGEIFA